MARTRLFGAAAALAAVVALATGVRDAAACGGLVAPNGAVRLTRATTLVAWHAGVEHYMTSFAYAGDVPDVGWIVPLPAVPSKIEKGGAWTLQRLAREVNPQPAFALDAGTATAAAPRAQVLETAVIDALDITVIRGSGQAVLDWCAANHFGVNAETANHILAYARTSPIFMAAKYDLTQARLRNSFTGDGTPVLLTMSTPRLWVPLEVLANGDDPVDADLYLLTDSAPQTAGTALFTQAPGSPVAPGMHLVKQEPMNDSLFHDLSTDRNMSWVRPDGWLTALRIEAPGRLVTYDMTVQGPAITTAAMGAGPDAALQDIALAAGSTASLAAVAGVVALAVLGAGAGALALFGLLTRPGRRRTG